jgi:hypothetical protein
LGSIRCSHHRPCRLGWQQIQVIWSHQQIESLHQATETSHGREVERHRRRRDLARDDAWIARNKTLTCSVPFRVRFLWFFDSKLQYSACIN